VTSLGSLGLMVGTALLVLAIFAEQGNRWHRRRRVEREQARAARKQRTEEARRRILLAVRPDERGNE
jgi:hypothetical protein